MPDAACALGPLGRVGPGALAFRDAVACGSGACGEARAQLCVPEGAAGALSCRGCSRPGAPHPRRCAAPLRLLFEWRWYKEGVAAEAEARSTKTHRARYDRPIRSASVWPEQHALLLVRSLTDGMDRRAVQAGARLRVRPDESAGLRLGSPTLVCQKEVCEIGRQLELPTVGRRP